MMKHMYKWINGLGESRKRSTLERLRKEAVRDHKNIRLPGEGGLAGAEGSIGQGYGHQAQAAIQGYVQNLPGFGGGRSPGLQSPAYVGGGGSGGWFPDAPRIAGQLPNLFGGSEFGNREGPEDAPPQLSPYAPSYAQPSYDDGSFRSFPPEPSLDQTLTYAPPRESTHAPNYPEPPGGGYQPPYDTPPQFGFGGGTGGYGDVGGFSGGLGHRWPSQPPPQPQNEGTDSDAWQGDQQYGFAGGPPGFPDPQQRFGF